MTNEKGLFAQADLRNVRGSTIERKIMSTKTLRKRITLTAVVALGAGLLSVAPANAAVTLPMWIDTATTVGGVAVTANTSTVTRTLNTQVNAAAVSAITAPAGSAIIFTVKTGSTFTSTDIIDTSINGTVVQSDSTLGTAATAVTATRNLPSPTVTTTYAYNLRVYETASTRSAATLTVDLPVSITVTPASGFSSGASTAFANQTVATGTALTDGPFSGSKNLGTQAGNITVTANLASGSACLTCTVGGYITGPGYLGIGTSVGAATTYAGATPERSLTYLSVAGSAGVANIAVVGDGTAGVATVTITVKDSAGTSYTVATKTVTFYGPVKTLKVIKQPYTYLQAGGATSGIKTGLVSAATTTLATSPAFSVEALDSAGNAVGGLTLSTSSSDATVVATASSNEDVIANDANGTWGGPGYYVFDATSAQSSQSGAKATLTVKILDPADTTNTTYITTTVPFAIGGAVAKEVISTDKASYAPGEVMAVTITATDKSGNPVYDGAASPALTFSKAVGGAFGASVYVAGKRTNSANTLFAPVISGPLLIAGTGTDVAATAITGSTKVGSANDAQIASLITKINALAALIAKIQKKLGVK